MTTEILLPTWIKPQAESSELVDDSTSVFRGAYAPGIAQRVSYVEPRLQVRQSFKSLRGNERAAMISFLNRAKGKFATVRAVVGYALRGSFPTTELFQDNDVASGTTAAWTSNNPPYTTSVADRVFRATRNASGSGYAAYQNPPYTQFAPHIARAIARASNQNNTVQTFNLNGTRSSNLSGGASGYGSNAYIPLTASGTDSSGVHETTSSGIAGDYLDINWQSFARCAQPDNGSNLSQQSDDFTNAFWTKLNCTIVANTTVAPDGTTTGDGLRETAVTANHEVDGTVTVGSGAGDYAFTVCIKAGTRTWVQILIDGSAGSMGAYFDLTNGVPGSIFATGTTWTSARVSIASLGSGWWRCCICGTKIDASTSLKMRIIAATANGTNSYLGVTGSDAIVPWRATITQSSTWVREVQSTTAAIASQAQTGNTMNVKGLPASTSGLLLPGDAFEINGELKTVTAALDSNANGLGILQFAPALFRSPSDSDGIVIAQPMGKFILVENASWVNNYGVYADFEITLEAINE